MKHLDVLIRQLSRVLVASGTSLVSVSALAQGQLDPTFGTNGRVLTSFTAAPSSDRANAAALQADGKLVVVGMGPVGFQLARYRPDGSLDPAFGTGGKVTSFGSPAYALTTLLQTDGKIVAAGSLNNNWALSRYTTDGSPDPTFGTNGLLTMGTSMRPTGVRKLGQQSSGKLIVFGTGRSVNYELIVLNRLNANGSVDNTFTSPTVWTVFPGAGGDQALTDGLVDASDRLLVAGRARDPFGNPPATYPSGELIRLLPNGAYDTSFGSNGVVRLRIKESTSIECVRQLPNGQILVAGYTSVISVPNSSEGFLARYSANGILDPSFGTNGVQLFQGFSFGGVLGGPPVVGLAVQADGKIVVRGSTSSDFAVARFLPNGAPDTSFGVAGLLSIHEGAIDVLTDLHIQADGKYLASGFASGASLTPQDWRFAVLRLLGSSGGALSNQRPGAAACTLTVYPNPSLGDAVTVEVTNMAGGPGQLRLLNALGQVLRTEQLSSGGNLRCPFLLGRPGPGVYTLQLTTQGGTTTQRLLVR